MMEHQRIKISRTIGVSLFLAALIISFSNGCYYDVEDILYPPSIDCDTTVTTYAAVVLPIIENNCYVCHDASTSLGDVALQPHSALETYALNGSLMCTIRHEANCNEMPKNANKLSDCDIEKIQRWVNNGALEN
ncbi:MAG: hypothetical protein HKN39_06155 [Flavobacteriales bacterium]|nr:hypothetical protein [Flavobacteriales bacterium]